MTPSIHEHLPPPPAAALHRRLPNPAAEHNPQPCTEHLHFQSVLYFMVFQILPFPPFTVAVKIVRLLGEVQSSFLTTTITTPKSLLLALEQA